MNETLYIWTFKFHNVVRQHNSGAVEDFILPHSAVYLRIQKWKNYWNRSTFAKVIVKIKVAQFFTHSVDIYYRVNHWDKTDNVKLWKLTAYFLSTTLVCLHRQILHCVHIRLYCSRAAFQTYPRGLWVDIRVRSMNTVKNLTKAGSPIKAVSRVSNTSRGQNPWGLLLEVLRYWRPTDY